MLTLDTTIEEVAEHLYGRFAKELAKCAKQNGADDIRRLAQSRRELGRVKLVLRFRPHNGENFADQRKRAESCLNAVKALNTKMRRKELLSEI